MNCFKNCTQEKKIIKNKLERILQYFGQFSLNRKILTCVCMCVHITSRNTIFKIFKYFTITEMSLLEILFAFHNFQYKE